MEVFELARIVIDGSLAFLYGNAFWQALSTEWAILVESRALFLMGVSAICGAMVGLEREHAEKPAGLRTNMMICLGSTLFTLASIYSWQHLAGASPTVDPGRIAAQIVTGVGFIGAGVIIKTGPNVHGITTAATIWTVAAIGILTGLGFPLFGFLAALATTTMLFILGGIELHSPK